MKKRIFIGITAVVLLIALLTILGLLVRPKYVTNSEGLLTGGYYSDVGGHDVIVVGDCEVYEAIVPSVLWNEYGVTSYIRGGAQQLAWHSYYLLEETFRYEKPKVVIFNVYALKYGEPQSEAYNRMTFDTMKMSSSKIKGIFASMTKGENFLDYVFPLLRYHSRITQLNSDDFRYIFKLPEDHSDNGYLIKTGIIPMEPFDPINEQPEDLLPNSSLEYLDKMKTLCDENGARLVLIKAPTNSRGYWWYDEWDDQVRKYAEDLGVDYYNFIPYADEMKIDWQTDTYDGGLHLNANGAEKFTKYLGKVLSEQYGLTSHKDDGEIAGRWNEYLDEYNRRKNKTEDTECEN